MHLQVPLLLFFHLLLCVRLNLSNVDYKPWKKLPRWTKLVASWNKLFGLIKVIFPLFAETCTIFRTRSALETHFQNWRSPRVLQRLRWNSGTRGSGILLLFLWIRVCERSNVEERREQGWSWTFQIGVMRRVRRCLPLGVYIPYRCRQI